MSNQSTNDAVEKAEAVLVANARWKRARVGSPPHTALEVELAGDLQLALAASPEQPSSERAVALAAMKRAYKICEASYADAVWHNTQFRQAALSCAISIRADMEAYVSTLPVALNDTAPQPATPASATGEAGKLARELDGSYMATLTDRGDIHRTLFASEVNTIVDALRSGAKGPEEWKPVSDGSLQRQVAWVDDQARYVGVYVGRQQYLLALPSLPSAAPKHSEGGG